MTTLTRPPVQLELRELAGDPRRHIIVCCGAGGVGKTTVSAALAVAAAQAGRRTVVLTIDPARRLGQALGIADLNNTPRHIAGVGAAGGELHAMMLDMKLTFDELVLGYAKPERAAEILRNPFYKSLSSSLSGTQEYMAMEKLGQLHASGDWDLIVVDTPPSGSALDFLDAPQRMASFLDSKMARLLLAPARTGGRAFMRAFSVSLALANKVISKVIGARVLAEAAEFASAAEALFGGFTARANKTYSVLKTDDAAFAVITAPQTDAVREAAFLVERLQSEGLPLAGVIANRMHSVRAEKLDAVASEQAAASVAEESPLTAAALALHAQTAREVEYERSLINKLMRECPDVPIARIPAQDSPISDLTGLLALTSPGQLTFASMR